MAFVLYFVEAFGFLCQKLSEKSEFEAIKQGKKLEFPLLTALKTHKFVMSVCALMSFVLSSGLATFTIIVQNFEALFHFNETQRLLYSNSAIVCIILGILIQ